MLRLYAKQELKKIRESVCSQNEMVKLLEMQLGHPFPRSTYAHKENGDFSASSDEALAISRILKVEVDELFTQKEAPDTTETEEVKEGESNA